MIRWQSLARRGVVTLGAVLCIAAATPAAAQQLSAPAPQASASAAADVRGPRLSAEFQSVEPALPETRNSRTTTTAVANHTITITTLALVLAVVLIVLLVAD